MYGTDVKPYLMSPSFADFRHAFYYCAFCVLSLIEWFYVYFIVYDHVHAFVGD